MREVLLKVVDACPCDCAFCDSNEMFRTRFGKKTFELDTWKRIVDDLALSGLEVAIITGGEPFLKPDVVFPLITHLREKGIFVSVNTSGAQFRSKKLMERLVRNYPDLLVFSIDSSDAGQHDASRVRPGLFDLILEAVRSLKANEGSLPIGIRMVITKRNYRQIPDVIRIFHGLGVECIKFTNIEDDRKGEYLLSVDDLIDFDRNVRPQVLAMLEKSSFQSEDLRRDAIQKFTSYFSREGVRYEDLAAGRYAPWLNGHADCQIIQRFGVIQSNGELLPCCESEHHYAPVLGNVSTTRVADIYSGPVFLDLVATRPEYCVGCTEPHNMQITFAEAAHKVDQR